MSGEWAAPAHIEGFSDAVAAILQVAVDAGYDLAEVCDAALAIQHGVRRDAAMSIRRT